MILKRGGNLEYEAKDIKINAGIKYDGQIALATGKSKRETHWKNKSILWSDLVDKLSNTTRTDRKSVV